MTHVLIDNGHGTETAGKRSPDGQYREGVYSRDMARRLAGELECHGIPCHLIVPEPFDTPLRERTTRANSLHRQNHGNTILLSLHSDASQGSGWSNARGMSVRLSQNASKKSKLLARCLYAAWDERALPTRKWNGDEIPWWPQNLAICRDTVMPAVLVEMFFHTNREQVEWAMSHEGKNEIMYALADGVRRYLAI